MSFAASHLPGAINMPPARVDELAAQRISGRDTEVVVYCTSPTCESSVDVATRLIELGYRNVVHYAGRRAPTGSRPACPWKAAASDGWRPT